MPSSSSLRRANSFDECPGAAREAGQVARTVGSGRRQREGALDESARQPPRFEVAGPRVGAPRGVSRLLVGVRARAPRRTLEIGEEAVQDLEVPLPPPPEPGAAQDPGGGERAAAAFGSALEPFERERAGSQRLAQHVGGEPLADPVEKRERRPARAREPHGDAARERARNLVLAGELPRQARVDGGIGVENLDVVERDLLLQDPAEDLADLVLLSGRAEEARAPRDLDPGVGRIGAEGDRSSPRELFQELPLECGQLGLGAEQVGRAVSTGACGCERLERAPQDGVGVDGACLLEQGGVSAEDLAQLAVLVPVGKRRGGKPRRVESRCAKLVEGRPQGAVEPRPIGEDAEVGVRSERFRAGLFHEREGLRAREQAQAFSCERRADDGVRERAHRFDPEVDPCRAAAREPLGDLVPDRERGRDEDLLLERPLAADAREVLDEERLSGEDRARARRRREARAERPQGGSF